MAGEWVRMRAVLLRHPKVLEMADSLHRHPAYIAWATEGGKVTSHASRAVTVRVTVASLLCFWSAANELATDGILRHANRHTCDEMAGIPGFGEALVLVGWAEEDEAQRAIILPNFHEFNTESKQRSSGADRTARWRERKKKETSHKPSHDSVTGDVTKTSQVTYRREEKRRSTSMGANRTPSPRKKPACACPETFEVTDIMAQWAVSQGLQSDRVIPETEKFLDHWRGNGKLRNDWDATWRNWIRKAVEFTR
jgi:hypothetical protein